LLLTQPIIKNIDWKLLPNIYLTHEECEQGKDWIRGAGIDLHRKITMIGVLGSSTSKTLPFATMAQLIDELVDKSNSQVLFNYIPHQKVQAQAIYALCSEQTQESIFIDAFAPSIRDFLGILANCDAMLGNEGGAINMAKALNIPTFTIFSPWITKEVWNAGEDDLSHFSVHLKDYHPELYTIGNSKDRKKKANSLYQKISIEDFRQKLMQFIEINL
jgi:heptosyltransferase-2